MIEWSSPLSGGVLALVGAACVALLFAARRWAISPQLRRWTLFVPRVVVLGALFLVLLNPVRRSESGLPARPARVDFLVDSSLSMALDQPRTRSATALAAIQSDDAARTESTRARVQLYRFGEQLASASDTIQLTPQDDASRLGAALEQLAGRFSRDLPRGVVIFSDGIIDDETQLNEVAAAYQRIGIPLHVYPVGNTQVRGDIALQELVLPPRLEVGAKVPIRGVVRGRGFAGERVVVQLRATGRPTAAPLATLPLTLNGEPQPFELVVEANRDQGELELEIPELPGEVSGRNNRVPFRLLPENRKIRVLYMEGTGGAEYRFVHEALREDPEIECVSLVADAQYVQRPRLVRVDDPLRGFPATREELLTYDCVICSDISMGAFTREQLEWTVELVEKRGGGFVMVGGITSFGAGNWDQSAWDRLIPIDMAGGGLGRGWLYHQFQVSIPTEAAQHPIWRIVEDPAQNTRVLARMPPFRGTNYMQRLKPAATPLAFSATPIPNAGIMPIFAVQPYGRGRTFAFAPDTTADWGMFFETQWGEGDNRYFRRFWRNVVRWLTENSVSGDKRLRIETDRVIYRRGQPISLTVRAYDEQQRETTKYQVVARAKSAASATNDVAGGTSLTPAADGMSYVSELPPETLAFPTSTAFDAAAITTAELEVIAYDQEREVARTTTKLQLLADSRELDEPRPKPELLEKLAAAGGGQVIRDAQMLTNLLRDLKPTPGDVIVSRTPLWDRPAVWLVILGLLSFEWILRRRASA